MRSITVDKQQPNHKIEKAITEPTSSHGARSAVIKEIKSSTNLSRSRGGSISSVDSFNSSDDLTTKEISFKNPSLTSNSGENPSIVSFPIQSHTDYKNEVSSGSVVEDRNVIDELSDLAGLPLRFLPYRHTQKLELPAINIEAEIGMDEGLASRWLISTGLGSNYILVRYKDTPIGLKINKHDQSLKGISAMIQAELTISKFLAIALGVSWNKCTCVYTTVLTGLLFLLQPTSLITK